MKEHKSEKDQAKGLLKEMIEQFGIDDVSQAAAEHGITDMPMSEFFDSGLFDDEDDIPEDRRVNPEDDIEIVPAYDGIDFYKLILNTQSITQTLAIDPVKFPPCPLVPLLMPSDLKADNKGNIQGVADVSAIGARRDGCRYVKINLGGKQMIKVKGKTVTVGPEITVILCTTTAAKAQSDVFKNAFDLTKLREMGGTTKPGGAAAKVQVRLGWKKGNNPIRDTKKPNTWRAPDAVEKS